jgi:hypothetical protein
VSTPPLAAQCEVRVVSADYFRTLGIAINTGRGLFRTAALLGR